MLSTNEHTRYVCCKRISLALTQLQSFKFGYSVFALLLVYNLILDAVPGTSVTAFTFDSDLESGVPNDSDGLVDRVETLSWRNYQDGEHNDAQTHFQNSTKKVAPCTRVVFTS